MQPKPLSAWEQQMRAPRGFLLLVMLGLLYALPIMLDGRYYLDDLPHAMNGLTLWEKDGRPLASILSSLISFSWPSFSGAALYDTSPLPQILGVVALAYGAARLAEKLFPAGVGLVQALVVFPVIGSPFMLQNLSYKFDAFTMGLAVMLALVAALETGWLVAAALLASLMLYQAAFNIFIGTCALLWLVSAARGLPEDRGFLKRLAWGLGALLVYGVAMKLLGGFSWDYATTHSALVPFSREGLATLQFNFGFGTFFMMEVVQDAPLLAAGAGLAAFAFAVQFAKPETGKTRERMARFILALGIIFCAVMGVLLFLQSPVMRPRTLMGFSILLVFAAYCAHEALKAWPNLRAAALALATAWFFALANIYANAAHDETRFDLALSQNVARDLLAAGFKAGGRLAFDGTQPLSPIAENAARLKTVARILQPNMNGNSEWGFRQLEFIGLQATPIMDATDEGLKAFCSGPPALFSPQYQIYLYDSTALVSFPKGVCFKS
jgi:hypothetical protein